MSEPGDPFLEACGAGGPWQLEWRDEASQAVEVQVFHHPAALVGRSSGADVRITHPDVSKRHAYLQIVEGRLFAIDLESRDGLRWEGVPRPSGWVDRGRPVDIGPITLRLVAGASGAGDDPAAGPGPTSPRFASRNPLPGAGLEYLGVDGEPQRGGLDRVVTLIGSSPRCPVRLFEPGTSRFVAALVWTPKGVWIVDLLSTQGIIVNGVACRGGRLEDGDTIRVGCQEILLTYDGTLTRSGPRLSTGGDWTGLPAPLAGFSPETWELVPDLVLGPLAGREGPSLDAGGASPPRDHALMLLIRLMGEVHRDHLAVVREEMEQIRRLNREMSALRGATSLPLAAPAAPPTAAATRPPAPPMPTLVPPREPIASELSPRDRPPPQAVHALVGERLASWEKERQSRWRKVMDLLLVKP